eukprot:6482990-Alexandrium_andersonii.AAC.1
MCARGWWGEGWYTNGDHGPVHFCGRSWLRRRNKGRFNGSYSPVRRSWSRSSSDYSCGMITPWVSAEPKVVLAKEELSPTSPDVRYGAVGSLVAWL